MVMLFRSTQSFSSWVWFLPKSTVRMTPEPQERLRVILKLLTSACSPCGPQSFRNLENG